MLLVSRDTSEVIENDEELATFAFLTDWLRPRHTHTLAHARSHSRAQFVHKSYDGWPLIKTTWGIWWNIWSHKVKLQQNEVCWMLKCVGVAMATSEYHTHGHTDISLGDLFDFHRWNIKKSRFSQILQCKHGLKLHFKIDSYHNKREHVQRTF